MQVMISPVFFKNLAGNFCIWATDPHPKKYQCLVNWKNMFNLQKFSCIIAIAFDCREETAGSSTNYLYLGDEMGFIRVFDLNPLLKMANITVIPKSFKEVRKVSPKTEDVRVFQIGIKCLG
jgi:hypothetical protein